jgi:protein-S-isoprenylcysteine O-methyltransferase Ste14
MNNDQDNAGIIAHPPFFYITAALLAILIDYFIPLSFENPTITKYAAFVVLGIGMLIFILSGRMFIKNKQSPSVHASQPKIITDGIYGKTRNPIYLSAHMFIAFAAFYFDNVWMLLMLVPMTYIITKFAIEKEERYLEGKFGEAYRDYKSRVRRWF